jgi:hypothetical protein
MHQEPTVVPAAQSTREERKLKIRDRSKKVLFQEVDVEAEKEEKEVGEGEAREGRQEGEVAVLADAREMNADVALALDEERTLSVGEDQL